MNREEAREWTRRTYLRYLNDEPDAYRTFLHLAASSCPGGGRVVDLGCGGEGYLGFLSDKAGEIIGIDSRPIDGPYRVYIEADLNREIPLERESMDLATSKFLLEHLENPSEFLRRVNDILRPGGKLVLMTPNILYYPYSLNYLLSRFLPQEWRMRLVQLFTGRLQEDVYPVVYRCNTPGRLGRELLKAGFEVVHLHTYSDCLVSAVNRPLGALAVAYEVMVSSLGLKEVRGFMVAEARKTRSNVPGSGVSP